MFTWEIMSYYLRILIMSWLFKDPVAIMKEIRSWLFKDPTVTVVWLNFDHAQLNSKKWHKKIKLPQMNFFLEKQLIKFSLPISTFHCTKLKILDPFQSYEGVAFLGPKWPIFPEHFFLVKTITTFIYLLALFVVQNF